MNRSACLAHQRSGERVDHPGRHALDSAAAGWTELANAGDAVVAVESVLLVDDDAWVRRSLARVLETAGLVVLNAQGGEALSLLSDPELPVDLLVLDIMMPGLSGLTVARRASSLRPDMGILFISGRVILPEGDPHPEVTGPLAFSENPSKLTCSSKR